jgi:small subunit ribosomal protein S6
VTVYETIAIIDASLPDETIEASVERIKDIITGDGGEVLKVDPWGKRKLAYEIKKHARGYYVLILFKAPASTTKKSRFNHEETGRTLQGPRPGVPVHARQA